MSAIKDEVASGWLAKSKRDLASAKVLLEAATPILDTAIYHCQQAGEKAVKGYLASKEQGMIQTHDIGLLVQQAMNLDPDFSKWVDIADLLTPYATAYRYPGDLDEPSLEEVREAIRSAESLVEFVITKLKSISE